ncbi:hypothetical protein F4780DRAFT_764387 [Xylariomycetidae sp. FL0641]|nr:hypothetical protein F4780DRAFT_764387 [Xylariomycetidae sp. FL0641]
MPTPVDNALKSKNAVLAFSGLVTAGVLWALWGSDGQPPDPKGNPENWTREEMRQWLAARNLHPQASDSREQLLERVKLNMRQ